MPLSFYDCCYCKDNDNVFEDGTVLHLEILKEHKHYFVECNRCKKINIAVNNRTLVFDEYLYSRYLAANQDEMFLIRRVPEGVDEVRGLLKRVHEHVDFKMKRRLKHERARLER